MKNRFHFLLVFGFLLTACHHNATDSLIGTWTVDKINVQFDEQRTTPDLVKQIGEMEKQNVITINKDSTLIFKGLDSDWQGRISLSDNGTLLRDGVVFGVWKDGEIVTRTDSPIGEVVVTYRKAGF